MTRLLYNIRWWLVGRRRVRANLVDVGQTRVAMRTGVRELAVSARQKGER